MKNIPIIGKFLAVIAVFGVFVIGAAFYATSQMWTIDSRYTDLGTHKYRVALYVAQGSRSIQSTRAAIGDLLQSTTEEGDRVAAADVAQGMSDADQYLDRAAKNALPAEVDAITALKTRVHEVVDHDCAAVIAAGKKATAPADVLASQQLYLKDCSPVFAPIKSAARDLVTRLEDDAQKQDDALTVQTTGAIAMTYGVILGGLMLVIGIAFFTTRAWIVTPIINMSNKMRQVSTGDTSVEVDCRFRKDELGKMGMALEDFRLAAIEKVRLEAEATAQREATEAERAARARDLGVVVDGVATGLAKLSDGDLVYRLEDAFAAEYEKLRRDFNGAMDKLAETMKVVSTNASAIHSGTGEISTAADDLSRRTEQQAASLEETAAALDQITATVRKTADGAIHARDVVGSAKGDAEKSGEVVREAVAAMSGIERSSGQIGQIIGVIDEIAFQTNLLALNAGVEAARAGDAGRGFAVVASEVRALAQRSAEAAKEIKALISTSGQQVASGVSLVGEAGRALERIVTQVTEINGVVGEIAASAQEQAIALNQVNTAVNQMDQVTQQNAAMVEETTAASHSLAHEAEALSRLIAKFDVGQDGSAEPARRAPPRPVARLAPHGGAPRAAALKTVGTGGAARKPQPVAAEDSWEEF